MPDDDGWLTIERVRVLLRQAGYPDSPATIRRHVDAGHYGEQGSGWYRTDSGYRMIHRRAVDALIERRRNPSI